MTMVNGYWRMPDSLDREELTEWMQSLGSGFSACSELLKDGPLPKDCPGPYKKDVEHFLNITDLDTDYWLEWMDTFYYKRLVINVGLFERINPVLDGVGVCTLTYANEARRVFFSIFIEKIRKHIVPAEVKAARELATTEYQKWRKEWNARIEEDMRRHPTPHRLTPQEEYDEYAREQRHAGNSDFLM